MSDTVLVVGSGAREHAIAAALARSPQQPRLVCFGSAINPGIRLLCSAYTTGSLTSPKSITAFARENGVTLAIIGPEAPLAAGVADALWARGIPVVGPRQSLARIESSKSYARTLLDKHGIPGNPFFQRFTSLDGVEKTLLRFPGQHVIKDDGLAGGKGVKVCGDHLHTHQDSMAFCQAAVHAGHAFVIEEKLEGEEFSLMSFCDGKTLQHMPAVQDHKRAFEDDRGPNTGGMGSYSEAGGSLPFLLARDIEAARRINEQVSAALASDCGLPYQGILYGGFMATRDGVKLIEYNARFGDPECLNVLTLLDADFLSICRAIVQQTLTSAHVEFAPQASVCKYVVPNGYPDAPLIGEEVHLPTAAGEGLHTYLSAVDERDGKLIATGSRTIAAVAIADTLVEAEALCEDWVARVSGPFFHRADIGTERSLIKRLTHMKELRG